MATDQKLKPCPKCKTDEHLAIYSYDAGYKSVECDNCFYIGPASGSRRWAIKLHNKECEVSTFPAAPLAAKPEGE